MLKPIFSQICVSVSKTIELICTNLCKSLLFFLFLLPYFLFAQNSYPKTDTISLKNDTLFLSHKHIVPFSEKIENIIDSCYSANYEKGFLIISQKCKRSNIVIIHYRYFPEPLLSPEIALKKIKFTKDTLDIRQFLIPEDLASNPWQEISETSKLRKTGQITRGLSVGNAQGATLTSGMRLQIEGDLGDGLKIVGSITDDNIPIQPDGTTQQISDFDKVFVQLKKDAFSVTVGDYEIQQKNTRFADVYRNVQGIKVAYNKGKTNAFASGAIAKGKFHSNSLIGLDGVAGPYQLTGKSGEKFFTVLAGSEKVYLNGKLMLRGETNDYIMDYNTAQITFTAKQVITNITRIVVDFEYTDRFFNRSLLFAQAEHTLYKDKIQLRFSYGRDADNANAPFDNRDAYFAIKDTLATMGDATGGLVYTSGAILDSNFNRTTPFYLKKDTIVNGFNYQDIYIYTSDSLLAEYRVFFTFVGTGKGQYKRDISGFNNYVYKWTAPDSLGNLQGDYMPVKPWILPKKLETTDVYLKFQISPKLQFYTENALSIEDKNLLSSKDDEDNKAFAHLSGLKWENIKLKDSLLLTTDISYSFVAQKFNNLDRVYKAEYGRVWNFNEVNSKRFNENIGLARLSLSYKNKLKLQTENGVRQTGTGRFAFRQAYTISSNYSKFLQGNYTYTNILAKEDSIFRNAMWQRHEGDIFYKNKWLKVGTEIWIENKKENIADSTAVGSLLFYDIKPYLRTLENEKFLMDISVNYRYDKEFYDQKLREKSVAYTTFFKMGYTPSEVFRILNTTSYRMLNVLDTIFLRTGLNTNRVLNTNLQTSFIPKNRIVSLNVIYEISAEQIAQRDVQYIQVIPGYGTHEWIDADSNNIQSVNEFVLSNNPLVANYIRSVLPTQRLVPTTKPALQANMRWDLKKTFPKSKNILTETVRNFKTYTTLRISQSKQRENSVAAYIVRLRERENDTALIDMGYNFRQEFTFFQNSTKGDIRFAYQNNQQKQFLNTGAETRGNRVWTFAQRLTLDNNKSIEIESNTGKKFANAVNFSARNYTINYLDTRPQLNWQLNRKLRISGAYQYKNKQNLNDSLFVDSKLFMHKIILENRWNLKNRNNLNTKLELLSITQNNIGDGANFTANYELLESLKPGFNAIWQSTLTYFIFKDMELSLTYEGRTSEGQAAIHTGRAQVRAFF